MTYHPPQRQGDGSALPAAILSDKDLIDAWVQAAKISADLGLVPQEVANSLAMKQALEPLTPEAAAQEVREALAAGPAAEMALATLDRAFAPGDVIELRACDPAGGGCLSLCGLSIGIQIRPHFGVQI